MEANPDPNKITAPRERHKYDMAIIIKQNQDAQTGNTGERWKKIDSDAQGQAASRQQFIEQSVQRLVEAQKNNDAETIGKILSEFQGEGKKQIIAMARQLAAQSQQPVGPIMDVTGEYQNFSPDKPQAMGNNSGEQWNETLLGKFEGAIKQTPEALRQSEIANQEAYKRGVKNKTVGTTIPNINTFRRTY